MGQGDGDGGPEFFENTLFMYLAVLGLSCGTWDLQSSLQHVGSLVPEFELLVVACRI